MTSFDSSGSQGLSPRTFRRLMAAAAVLWSALLAVSLAVNQTPSNTPLWGKAALWLVGVAAIGLAGRDGGRWIRRHQTAVARLAHSEELFRATFDLAAVGIANVGLDGAWLTVNRCLCEITGYSVAELVGGRYQDITHPDDHDIDADAVRRLLAGEKIVSFEKRYRHRDGGTVWVSATASPGWIGGRLSHFIAVVEDITARKEAERELRLTKFAVDQIHDGVAWSDASGRFLYVNDAFCRLHALSREHLLGMSIVDLNPALPAEAWAAHWAELTDKGSLCFEARCRGRDGEMIPIEVSANLLCYEGREYNVAFVRDIRERKQAEDDMRRSIDELSRSNSELERFAFVASHDLQEPSRTVISFAQLLERKLADRLETDERELLVYLVDGARRMHDLVRDLLSYSRVTGRAEAFAPVDLSEVAAMVRDSLRALIEESGAEIVIAPLPVVSADRSQMLMLFQNLLGNAVKFRVPGVRPVVRIDAKDDDGMVTISVVDNGIGIAPVYAEEIFVIFKRLHTAIAYPGTGIGLAVCKRIVERHHGRIWVEPGEGGGSVFRFTLPRLAEPA